MSSLLPWYYMALWKVQSSISALKLLFSESCFGNITSYPKVIFASHLCKLTWIDNCIIFGWLRTFGEKINDIDLANLGFSQVGGELCTGLVARVLPGGLSLNVATKDGKRVGAKFLIPDCKVAQPYEFCICSVTLIQFPHAYDFFMHKMHKMCLFAHFNMHICI